MLHIIKSHLAQAAISRFGYWLKDGAVLDKAWYKLEVLLYLAIALLKFIFKLN